MRARFSFIPLLLIASLAVGCGDGESTGDAGQSTKDDDAVGGTDGGPAGEVAPDTRAPEAGDGAEVATGLPAGVDEKWAAYFENIPFVFGSEAGVAAAEKSGKPIMFFYTATW